MQQITYQYEDAEILVALPSSSGNPSKKTKQGKIAVGAGLGYWTEIEEAADGSEMKVYVLTHLASGFKMQNSPIFSEEHIRKALEFAAPLLDWHLPLEQLIAEPNYKDVGKQLAEFFWQLSVEAWAEAS